MFKVQKFLKFNQKVFVKIMLIGGVYLLLTACTLYGKDIAQPENLLLNNSSHQDQDKQNTAIIDLGNIGAFPKWSKVEVELIGPDSVGLDIPNPFQIRVDVMFNSSNGETFVVPAFYDGDGGSGLDGNVWKVRFSPNTVGLWSFTSTSTDTMLNSYTGSFEVITPIDCQTYIPGGLPDFSCVGRLEYVGEHYLKFADGPYWLKGGVDEPEDFLALNSRWTGFESKEAAIDYLASKRVNSLYIMMHNVNGDGRNVWPWVGDTEAEAKVNNEYFDVIKLREWEDIFSYVQEKGLVLHLILEDDSGWTRFNREMFYREVVARFGHHNGLYWNIAEEYNENYYSWNVKGFAQMIRDLDPYDHPTTVHHAGSLSKWDAFIGDNRFDLTSLQSTNPPDPASINSAMADLFEEVKASGRTIPISFDETGQFNNRQRGLARHVVWAVYLGGANYEIFTTLPTDPNHGDGYLDYELFFEDMNQARTFVENLPFWQMQPRNDLVVSGQAYVFANPGQVYAAYLPEGGTIEIDLSSAPGNLSIQWFNPRTGAYFDQTTTTGGNIQTFTAPFNDDAVLQIESIE